ncbi:MAG: UDP-3-O-(3-hydroxymyristoyl)glucosamine N-acyltransferase [Gemmatimonadota bacterium]
MADAPVSFTALELAQLVGGRLEGDGAAGIAAVDPLDRAHGRSLSFLTGPKYLDSFLTSSAGTVLVPETLALPKGGPSSRIVVRDPAGAMSLAIAALFPDPPRHPGIHPAVILGRGVELGEDITIGPWCVLGDDVRLGDRVSLGSGVVLEAGVTVEADTEIESHVTCCTRTRIGARVRIKAGAVIGSTGFGYISSQAGHRRIPHVGGCVIEDDVDVGANSCIDRGSVDDTVIGAGTKIDNLVHIGHNARLGARCLVVGGVVIAGSARVGNDVILAGHSAVGGHLTVGDRVRVGAMSGVARSVPDGTDVSGFPARPHREFLRAQAALYRLARITDELEALVKAPNDHG